MINEQAIDTQQKLLEVAQQYEEEGYIVTLSSQADQLPGFLHPFPLNMIASRDRTNTHENGSTPIHEQAEHAVVEIRTRATLSDTSSLDLMAEAVEQAPNWRLDLVVTNPDEHLSWQHANQRFLHQDAIHYRLQEARQLSSQEHGEAALLLTWSTLESLLRRNAQTKQVPLEPAHRDNPLHLIKSLLVYGLLDQAQYQVLKSGVQAQQTIAHGYQGTESVVNVLDDLFTVADQLTGRYESIKAAER